MHAGLPPQRGFVSLFRFRHFDCPLPIFPQLPGPMNPHIQARQVRLNEVIATLDTFSDAFHSGGYGRPAVDQNKNLLQEAWSSLNYDAQEATMRMVEAALAKMETEQAEQKRSTGRCSQQSLVRCIVSSKTVNSAPYKELTTLFDLS